MLLSRKIKEDILDTGSFTHCSTHRFVPVCLKSFFYGKIRTIGEVTWFALCGGEAPFPVETFSLGKKNSVNFCAVALIKFFRKTHKREHSNMFYTTVQ